MRCGLGHASPLDDGGEDVEIAQLQAPADPVFPLLARGAHRFFLSPDRGSVVPFIPTAAYLVVKRPIPAAEWRCPPQEVTMTRMTAAAAALVALLFASAPAADAAYPDRQITLIVGFPSGSQPDLVARLLGQRLAESLREPVVVENIAG